VIVDSPGVSQIRPSFLARGVCSDYFGDEFRYVRFALSYRQVWILLLAESRVRATLWAS